MLSSIATIFLAAASLPCREVILPPVIRLEHCDKVEHTASFPRCDFGQSPVTEAVNKAVESRVRKEADYDAPAPPERNDCDEFPSRNRPVDASCGDPYVVANLVSYLCGSSWEGVHPDGAAWSINLEISSGATLRELKLRDVLLNAAAESLLWRLIRADLAKQISKAYANDPPDSARVDEQLAAADQRYEAFNLTRSGLVVSYGHSAFGYSVLDATIPYKKLHGILSRKFFPRPRKHR